MSLLDQIISPVNDLIGETPTRRRRSGARRGSRSRRLYAPVRRSRPRSRRRSTTRRRRY